MASPREIPFNSINEFYYTEEWLILIPSIQVLLVKDEKHYCYTFDSSENMLLVFKDIKKILLKEDKQNPNLWLIQSIIDYALKNNPKKITLSSYLHTLLQFYKTKNKLPVSPPGSPIATPSPVTAPSLPHEIELPAEKEPLSPFASPLKIDLSGPFTLYAKPAEKSEAVDEYKHNLIPSL